MKTVILVPIMYSEGDLKGILRKVPEDFQKESDEFWRYIEERLRKIASQIRGIYLIFDEKTVDPRAVGIIGFLQGKGVKAARLGERALVGEARAWYLAAQDSKGGIEEEFLKEVNLEISSILRRVLDSTLGEMEVGVVFLEPACRPFLGDNVRVIWMSPFDPNDYLTRHLTRRRLAAD